MNWKGALKRKLEPVMEWFYKYIRKPKTVASREEWQKNAQKGEFEFHKTNTWRQTESFMEQTRALFRYFGYGENDYQDKVVLDLGAGSKLRSKYFQGAKIVALEPMADDCLREIAWCDLKDAWKLFSLPAEDRIDELVETVDFAFSINVLDHCYNFDAIIANLFQYLKPGATAFLSFDAHYITNDMHPLILTEEICSKIFKDAGFSIDKVSKGFDGDFLKMMQVPHYGHGNYCLNYWLSKK